MQFLLLLNSLCEELESWRKYYVDEIIFENVSVYDREPFKLSLRMCSWNNPVGI